MSRKPRVLIAGTARAIRIVRESLGNTAGVVTASTIADALRRAEEADLVVTHVAFDESRMLDFVQALRARPAGRSRPVVCLRLLSPISPAMREAVVEALEVLGAAKLVDLYEIREQLGESEAHRELSRLLLDECARLRA